MKFKILLALVILLPLTVSSAFAQINLVKDTGGDDTKLKEKTWDWSLSNSAERFPSAPVGASSVPLWHSDGFWRMTFSSATVTVGSPKTLVIHIQHQVLPDGHDQDGQSDFTLSIPDVSRPAAGAAPILNNLTFWDAHPQGHYDVIKVEVSVPPAGPARIRLRGVHDRTNQQRTVICGYDAESDGSVTIFGSYPNLDDRRVHGPEDVRRGTRTRARVPEIEVEGTTVRPTDFRVRFEGSLSETTVAFVAQPPASTGTIIQIPLENAVHVFMEDSEFFAPMLLNENRDLFVAVDLSQWQGAAGSFSTSSTFSFHQGRSVDLPGVIVGTSPIRFDSSTGFVTDSPFNGDARFSGSLYGQSVASPSAGGNDQQGWDFNKLLLWLLIGFAGIGLLIFVLRRRGR